MREKGPLQIIREEGERFATVLSNVAGRDLVGSDEAKTVVAREGEDAARLSL